MASVWRHPQSQFWVACFTDASGRRRKISTKVTSRREALKIAAEYERSSRLKRTRAHTREAIERLNAELSGESYSGVSLRKFTAQWLESRSPEIAPSTGAFYVKTTSKLIAALGDLADQPMANIGKASLVKFRNTIAASGLAPKTVNQTLKVGRMLFKAAKRDGIISENPLELSQTSAHVLGLITAPSAWNNYGRCSRPRTPNGEALSCSGSIPGNGWATWRGCGGTTSI